MLGMLFNTAREDGLPQHKTLERKVPLGFGASPSEGQSAPQRRL